MTGLVNDGIWTEAL